MLGVFAKVVRGERVKTRLQSALTRQEAEHFHVASLADTLETALRLVAAPFLFLQGTQAAGVEDLRARLCACGFDAAAWDALCLHRQHGGNLGLRLEHAFEKLHTAAGAPGPALILGSDSPSLPPAYVRAGMVELGLTPLRDVANEDTRRTEGPHTPCADQTRDSAAANRSDLVLGPTTDGGFWAIGLRRPCPGLLHDITWSSARTFADTAARAAAFRLRTDLLPLWTDVDRPEDLHELARQITMLRQSGDERTARHSERFLADLGVHRA